jgi:hypothetical protein
MAVPVSEIMHLCIAVINVISVRFEVFTAVTMKNGVFWDITPCGSCRNRRFEGTWRQFPSKRRFLQEPHGVTSQKTPFFNVISVFKLLIT